jgi:DNA-binding SARP family transcriptional activator
LSVKFRVLGPLSVVDDGEELALGAAKQRTLLALLLLHRNEAVASERLIDWLWAGSPPPSAQKSLHVYVSGLRKTLGSGRLETVGRAYRLRVDEDEVDLDHFNQLVEEAQEVEPPQSAKLLAEALALYRGEPFAELRYEQVAQSEIARLDELRLQTLEQRIDADLACGRERAVLPELEALVSSSPLRERLRAQLMLALYRCGRQADALAVYRQGRELLDEQLGLEPGPELKELERRILEHDPEIAPPTRPRPRHPAATRRQLLVLFAGGALVLAAAIAAGVIELTGSQAIGGVARVAPESVGVLDPRSDRFLEQVPVSGRPSLMAVDGQTVWVVNNDQSHTIAQVSLPGRSLGTPLVPGVTPTGLAASRGVLWVVDAIHRKVVKSNSTYGVLRLSRCRRH